MRQIINVDSNSKWGAAKLSVRHPNESIGNNFINVVAAAKAAGHGGGLPMPNYGRRQTLVSKHKGVEYVAAKQEMETMFKEHHKVSKTKTKTIRTLNTMVNKLNALTMKDALGSDDDLSTSATGTNQNRKETEEELRAKIKRLKGKVGEKHKMNSGKMKSLLSNRAIDDMIIHGIEYMRWYLRANYLEKKSGDIHGDQVTDPNREALFFGDSGLCSFQEALGAKAAALIKLSQSYYEVLFKISDMRLDDVHERYAFEGVYNFVKDISVVLLRLPVFSALVQSEFEILFRTEIFSCTKRPNKFGHASGSGEPKAQSMSLKLTRNLKSPLAAVYLDHIKQNIANGSPGTAESNEISNSKPHST